MTPNTRPLRAPGFLVSPLDDELLLYQPDSTRAMYMNATASVIWGLCDGGRTVAEITSLLREVFPEDEQGIGEDVRSTLEDLLRLGALVAE